jgi:hypothetical protein
MGRDPVQFKSRAPVSCQTLVPRVAPKRVFECSLQEPFSLRVLRGGSWATGPQRAYLGSFDVAKGSMLTFRAHIDPFAKVSALSRCPTRLHRFPRLLRLTSLTHAKVSPRWAVELAPSPPTTRSSRSDSPRPAPDRRTAPSGLSGPRETSACCAQERLRRGQSLLCSGKGFRHQRKEAMLQ